MRIVNDYSFLFKNMPGTAKPKNAAKSKPLNLFNQIKLSDINGKSAQEQLKAAGIDTGGKQYQAVMNMMSASVKGGAVAYTNPQAIKNLMSSFDKDGNKLNAMGVAGMDMTNKTLAEAHQIIDVSEEWRQNMFDETKRHFAQEYGVANGDTTRRSEVFTGYQLSVPIEKRLNGTWTLGQYERNYRQAFYDAVKAENPKWQIGNPFDTSILDKVSRTDIDNSLVKAKGLYGGTDLVRK